MTASLIVGLSGVSLTDDERSFLRDVEPAGIILFRRNVFDRSQFSRLVAEAKAAVGRDDFLVLIDQEGGRVQRLRPPIARALPPGAAFADLYAEDPELAKEAAFAIARLTADELRAYGITMNCAPVADLPVEGAHEVISDRAYGRSVPQVVALAQAVAEGYLAGGVVPVVKHIPGHGRATADSHFGLPVVPTPHAKLSATDFATFKALSGLPAAMTAHVVYFAIDEVYPASTSAVVTRDIIRGEIGFDNLLMSDDLSMRALSGPMRDRAEAVIAAGSDIALHCNGHMGEMRDAAEGVPALSGRSAERFAAACACVARNEPYDKERALQLLAGLMGEQTLIV